MAACPPLEDIAAFLDGRLSPEERAHVTEHLARCESCYEIFAGAVHFQEEEEASSAKGTGGRGVIQLPPLAQEKIQEKEARAEPTRLTRRASRWLGLAASTVLVTALGYMVWQRAQVLPEVTVAGVTESLRGKLGVDDALSLPDVDRGDEEEEALLPSSAPVFLAGAYLVDLRLSVTEGNWEKADGFLALIGNELSELFVAPESAAFFRSRIESPADLERLARELPQQESALDNEFSEDPLFRFGIWTEAGRVSAAMRSPGFFEHRANRRFLSLIPREIPRDEERYGPILQDLQKIEPLWERSPRDYDALAGHFESIIRQFELIQKDFDPLPAS